MGKALIACEESQAVAIEARKLGVEAYSCDIIPCSGGHPEWHLQQDVVGILQNVWDLIIAFPPCTYLTKTGNRWFNVAKYGEKAVKRHESRNKAIDFFMAIASANCKRIAIENPVGVISTAWRKPDQIIDPYQFGDPFEKKTCLWLKGLPLLTPTQEVVPQPRVRLNNGKVVSARYKRTCNMTKSKRARARSVTFPGIAKAMAQQWAILIN